MPLLDYDEVPHDREIKPDTASGGEASPFAKSVEQMPSPDVEEVYSPLSVPEISIARPTPSARVPKRLRRTKVRINHSPMDSLPENTPAPAPPSSLSSADAHGPELLTPNRAARAATPLISAFRKSVTSVASTAPSLPPIQHYPSFTGTSVTAASSRSRSPVDFYSASSAITSASQNIALTEHGELRPESARLKGSGDAEHVADVQSAGRLARSRQASLVYFGEQPAAASSQTIPPGYPTSSNGSTTSVYTDARSIPADEHGRWR